MAALLRRILLLASLALLAAPPGLQGAGAQEARPLLTAAGIEDALVQMEALGAFFGAFAGRETNEAANERWYRLGINYQGTAAVLRRALSGGSLVIEDLPHGRRVALAEGGRIAVDDSVDGRWERGAEGQPAEIVLRDVLLPALFEALAQRRLPQDWPWLADHLHAVGGLVAPSQDPVARPLLARYFQAKDAYLWLTLRRIGEGDPAARQGLAQRQKVIFEAVRGLESEMVVVLGAAEAGRLQRDWSAFVAQVDGFAVTRGWVLLDPALRRTQLGAAALEAADAVDQAAAEVVAAAPRSEEPESDPVIAGQDEELDGARRQVATLEAKVEELAAALEARAREASRLEAALAAERERLADAEQRVPEQRPAAQPAAAEAVQPARSDAEPAENLAALLLRLEQRPLYLVGAVAAILLLALLIWLHGRHRTAAVAAPQRLLSAPDAAAHAARATPLPQRPFIEVPAVVPCSPTSPVPPRAPAPPTPEPVSPLPRVAMARVPEGARVRVNGVTPPTAAAKAAMQAATARRGATQAAAPPENTTPEIIMAAGAAEVGSEADTAAHPIVHALRQGNLPLFELLFSELTELRSPQLQRIVYGGRGEDLAIVCRAVGVDKLLFGSIFLLTDHLRGGSREEEPERTTAMLQMYDRMPPATARKVLAKWQRNWSGQRRGSMPDVH